MERELEVKILDIDVDDFEEKLKILGANLIKKEKQKNITINSSKNPISKERGYLRIRISQCDGEINKYFTFKENISSEKARDNLEHTTEIKDEDELIKILQLLDFDIFYTGTKNRTKYKYDDLIIDIDIWDKKTYPYPYVEIEGPSIEEIYKFLDRMEIDKKHVATLSIAELKENLKK